MEAARSGNQDSKNASEGSARGQSTEGITPSTYLTSRRRGQHGRNAAKLAGKPGMVEAPASPRQVAVVIETSGSYGRGVLRGISRYNREHGGWSTYFHPRSLGQAPPIWLRNWKGDGVLVRVDTALISEVLQNLKIPVVNLRSSNVPFPGVKGDHQLVAKLAADHLIERGLQNFAFCGKAPGIHSGHDERCVGFCRAIEAMGRHCQVFPAVTIAGDDAWEQEQEMMATWIKSLPKPIGIMTCNDERGLQVLDACRRRGVAVPDEVAVIGVDNDEYMCELAIPPLTSVDVNAEQIGYEAAALLDRLMDGLAPPSHEITVNPRGVVTRLSTDVVASDDDEVNRAIRYIRERGCNGLRVMDVLAHLGISRAALQHRMKRVLGRTIHEEIERMRLTRVKELLLKPDMTIKQVARETGFSSVQYMTRVFRTAVGETPARYRSHRDK
jgi:LacI family transcriptional regulator